MLLVVVAALAASATNLVLTVVLIYLIVKYKRRFTLDFETFRKGVDEETNRLAGVFDVLLKKAQTPAGLTPAEQAEAQATLDHMRGIGADAATPIPTPPPTPAADALVASNTSSSDSGTAQADPQS